MTGNAGDGAADYQAALKAKDAQIAELQGKVVDAAKTAEATEALNAAIAALKRQMADERVEFALRAADARSVKVQRRCLASMTATWPRWWRPSPGSSRARRPLHKGLHKLPPAAPPVWSRQAQPVALTTST